MHNELTALKNLGNTSVNWLHAVGIHNRADLAQVGAIEAYNRIRDRGIKVSKVLLYSLHCALRNQHWTELQEAEKLHLLNAAEQAKSCSKVA